MGRGAFGIGISAVRKSVAMLLMLSFFLPSTPFEIRSARAELDAATVTSLSMGVMVLAMTNSVSSISDCATEGGNPASYPWAKCGMLALTVASLVASIAQKKKNSDSASHFQGGGGGSSGLGSNAGLGDGGTLPTGDNAPLDYKDFCSKTPEFCNDCAKSGDFSQCKPQLQLPEGFPLDAVNSNPELKDALAAVNEAMDYINTNSDPSLVGSASDSGFAQSGDGAGGEGDPTYIKKKGVGKQDGEGLGRASIWGMDMVDEKSGAKLTLWQRATRRYYGVPDLKRLGFLARAEYVRSKAMQHAIANAKKASETSIPGRTLDSSKTGPKPVVEAKPLNPPRLPSSDKSSPLAPPLSTTKY